MTARVFGVAMSIVMALSLVMVAAVTFGAKSTAVSFVDYAQCADGTADDDATDCPGSWINGILQASNSTYHEDEVTPQRAELLVPAGAVLTNHTFTFRYQARKGSAGVHAYDSLATWNYTQTTADRNQGLNPNDRVAGAAMTFPIPSDSQVLAPFTSGSGATSGHELAQADRQFTMYGGTITAVSPITHDCVAAGKCNDPSVDDFATVTITYSVASAPQKVQLLFGGHLAASDGPRSWGAGLGASNISGGPYHIKWDLADNASIGNRDNQIMGSAILSNPSTITTVPSPSTATIGTSLQDTASISPSSATGTVTFNLFRPADATCASTPAYTETVNVSSGSAATVVGFVSDTIGTWHWTASYSGDGVNLPSTSACADEAVTVNKATPTLTTNASGPVTVGQDITDTAHLSGGYGTLTGTITFDVYGPGDTTCGTSLATLNATAAVNGAGNYTSAPFTTTAVGTYRWIAHFTDTDGNNNNVDTACNDANESSTVNQATPTASTTPNVRTRDNVTLSGGFGTITGTVDFALYDNATCTGTAVFTQNDVALDGSAKATSNYTDITTSGTYYWQVHYDGAGANAAFTSDCGEATTITLP